MRRSGEGTGSSGESAEARQRREASQRSLEQGGLPLNALDRLREQAARQGTPGHLFTSDLSAKELALVCTAGYEPLGQVMGSSVYRLGVQWSTPNWRDSDRARAFSYEMGVLTQGFLNARHLALGRLRQEAEILGATGVVGVRLERREGDWDEGLLEFVAIGTAIRERGRRPMVRIGEGSSAVAFLSNLSGQEFWALRQGGYRPLGLVIGNCTYYHIASWETRRVTNGFMGGSLQNQELQEYSQALYQARSLGMKRLEAEAHALAAEGVVGVQIEIEAVPNYQDENRSTCIGVLYHFSAIGTAIDSAPGPNTAAAATAIWLR